MQNEKNEIEIFLKKHNLHHSSINFDNACKDFLDEMNKGLSKENETLKMLPTYVTIKDILPKNEPIITIDAGGTNFRTAVVSFSTDGEVKIENFKNHSMPGIDKPITKDEFFDIVAEYLKPIINLSNKIAFCFSYPVNMQPNKDGKLIHFTKEIKITGMENQLICEGIQKSLYKLGINQEKKFILLNDTVSSMLAGVAFSKRPYSSYIGLILGTGVNTCYIEQNSNIKKLAFQTNGSMLINMELGGYSKVSLSTFDKKIDCTSENIGKQLYEKMISGAYLGKLIGYTIKGAIEDNIFSDEFKINFEKIDINSLSLKEINEFYQQPYNSDRLSLCCKSTSDRIKLYYIIDFIFERTAKLVVLGLSSIIMKTKNGYDPTLPVCICADGSVFNKCHALRHKIYYYMKQFLTDKHNIYFEFITPQNATLVGTAIAGLYNL